jgi:hypothetical protein
MRFIDLRKPRMTHLYFVYVFECEDGGEPRPSLLYRVGSVMDLKRKLRDRHRKYDIVKVW